MQQDFRVSPAPLTSPTQLANWWYLCLGSNIFMRKLFAFSGEVETNSQQWRVQRLMLCFVSESCLEH